MALQNSTKYQRAFRGGRGGCISAFANPRHDDMEVGAYAQADTPKPSKRSTIDTVKKTVAKTAADNKIKTVMATKKKNENHRCVG